ncbi:conserved hypothetical protein [Trichinella spiralis]|uniref:hypothetical protein n=1 Tax=Trichinella spiralis TaxID=6334 RepID=UPI0001EFC04A|nr:conserved hypothetical protein [Trichinella spiralis]
MRSKFGLKWTNAELAIETYLEMNQQVLHLYGGQELRELSLWMTSCAACVISRSTSLLQHFKESANKSALCKGFQPLASVLLKQLITHLSRWNRMRSFDQKRDLLGTIAAVTGTRGESGQRKT